MKLDIPGKLLLNALAGSHAYGLNTLESDEDYRGVFLADKRLFYSADYPLEISDESNDQSYFELSKFSDLLAKNNPTVLEFLAFPERCIKEIDPSFLLFKPEDFLTKQCQNSYVGYALGQIRKAYNLKKRISIPEDEEPKSAFHFCSVLKNGKVIPFLDSEITPAGNSLAEVSSGKDIYSIWKGTPSDEIRINDENVVLTKKEGTELRGYLLYDKAGFSKYQKEYKSFFLWKRDREVHGLTREHGEYDGKFLMHTFRLLYTAKDIATKHEIILERPEREKLLDIRRHKFQFGELIKEAEDLVEEVRELFRKSDLPTEVDRKIVSDIVHEIREKGYSKP